MRTPKAVILVALQVSHRTQPRIFSLYFVTYSPYRKMFETKVVDCSMFYILCHMSVVCTLSVFEKITRSFYMFRTNNE